MKTKAENKQLQSILIDLECGTIDKYAAYDLITTLYETESQEFAEWLEQFKHI